MNWSRSVGFWGCEAQLKVVKIMDLRMRARPSLSLWFIMLVICIAVAKDVHIKRIFIMLFITSILWYSAPPVAIFLGNSGTEGDRLLKKVKYIVPGVTVHLLRNHSMFSSLRGRPWEWRSSVSKLTDMVGLIIIDARAISLPLVEEAKFLLDKGHSSNIVVVVEDSGRQQLLQAIDPTGKKLAACGWHVVRELELWTVLKNLIKRSTAGM